MVDEDAPPTKKLTQEELQKSVDRLTRPHRREWELKPVIEKRTITQEQLEKHIKHLYDDSLARRQMEREEVARQMQADIQKNSILTTTQIDADEEEKMVNRLYEQSTARKERNFMELYARTTTLHKEGERKLAPAEQEKLVQHLYKEGMQRERDKHIALYEKFVLNRRAQAVRTQAYESEI
ncbi:unnamed protein product [Phytomonas sp. EM1]|nr:unnamed protein product [Phytomonas sp. EM1]|eukprot:CCW63343.1 unnamed protein product [Phytomonas sp. isolate EM1]